MSKVLDNVAQNGSMTRSDKVFLPRVFPYAEYLEGVKAEQLRTLVDEDGNEVCPWNEHLVETAGFVPLEVRMKQMEQNGLLSAAVGGELSPDDLREAWLASDFEISPDDELEEVLAKRSALNEFLAELKRKRQEEFEKSMSKDPKAFTPEEYQSIKDMLKERMRERQSKEPDDGDS